jgi:hypothetical protein
MRRRALSERELYIHTPAAVRALRSEKPELIRGRAAAQTIDLGRGDHHRHAPAEDGAIVIDDLLEGPL